MLVSTQFIGLARILPRLYFLFLLLHYIYIFPEDLSFTYTLFLPLIHPAFAQGYACGAEKTYRQTTWDKSLRKPVLE